MSAPLGDAVVEQAPVETPPPVEPATPPEPAAPEAEGELPDWAKAKLSKANREAQGLRERLKEAEPLVAAAREAEEANKTEAQRAIDRATAAESALGQRETELLQTRFGISDDYLEFIGTGTYAEKEERAAKLGLLVQKATPQDAEPNRPPSERPVASLRPGASPTPPPVEDTSYPASWGFQPPRGT